MTIKAVTDYTRLSRAVIAEMVAAGTFPPPRYRAGRADIWYGVDIAVWSHWQRLLCPGQPAPISEDEEEEN